MPSETAISSLMASLSCWEIAGYVSTGAVVAACAGEAIHELTRWFKLYDWWRKKGGAASALLLIAALAIEIPVQLKANSINEQIIGFLNRQTAELTSRNLDIQYDLIPRSLTGPEKRRLAEKIAGVAERIEVYSGDSSPMPGVPGDANVLVGDIIHAIADAKIVASGGGTSARLPFVGVRVYDQDVKRGRRIVEALEAAGVRAVDLSDHPEDPSMTAFPAIWVGLKPPRPKDWPSNALSSQDGQPPLP